MMLLLLKMYLCLCFRTIAVIKSQVGLTGEHSFCFERKKAYSVKEFQSPVKKWLKQEAVVNTNLEHVETEEVKFKAG